MGSGKPPILVIDPDVSFCKEISQALEERGYAVQCADGVKTGAQVLKSRKFTCVVMAVELREIRGYDAVPIIRAMAPGVPVIITADVNTKEQEAKVREQNVFYYCIKTFEREELLTAIGNAAGERKEEKKQGAAKVLIVDDEPDFVDSTRLMLESGGYEVEAAYNREEAFEKLEHGKPDLILLDVMMERLTDGFAICYKLKHDKRYQGIPILMVTAVTQKTGFRFSPETDEQYLEADEYVEKPLIAEDFLRLVRKLIGR